MKIVAYASDGRYCCRPDTTLNHNNSDYYCPEDVTALTAVPCIYTHIDKAGKCVAERFAGRYFKTMALGCLLSDAGDRPESEAVSMDFTSIMDMGWNEGPFRFEINGKEILSLPGGGFEGEFARAIVDITARTTIRIGDIIALEKGPGATVRPGDQITMISGEKRVTVKIF